MCLLCSPGLLDKAYFPKLEASLQQTASHSAKEKGRNRHSWHHSPLQEFTGWGQKSGEDFQTLNQATFSSHYINIKLVLKLFYWNIRINSHRNNTFENNSIAWVASAKRQPSPADTECLSLPLVSTGPEGILSPQEDQSSAESDANVCKRYLWAAKETSHLQTAHEDTS